MKLAKDAVNTKEPPGLIAWVVLSICSGTSKILDPTPELRFAWQLRPKHHVLHHLAEYMANSLLNVRYEHCFRDESAIGIAKRYLLHI